MSSISVAPYETTITSGLNTLQVFLKFIDDLSPAFITLITNNIALNKSIREQRKMDRRIRTCRRICRIDKLDTIHIKEQVDFDFEDLNLEQKQEMTDLLIYELITNKIK